MKDLKKLGKTLSRFEQKSIGGGGFAPKCKENGVCIKRDLRCIEEECRLCPCLGGDTACIEYYNCQ